MDVYERITEQVLKMMEQGVIPWKKSWNSIPAHNPITGIRYSGINQFILPSGYAFLSFNQIQGTGILLKKGSKGWPITFSSPINKKDKNGKVILDRNGDPEKFFMQKWFTVFCEVDFDMTNASERIKRIMELAKKEVTRTEIDTVEIAEKFINIPHEKIPGGNKAFYSPKEDAIGMPDRKRFVADEAYYSVYFHELCHWTSKKDRLNRDLGESFGTFEYAKEELIAEMGSAYLSDRSAISGSTLESSAAYLKNWKLAIQADKYLVIRAASAAKKAAQYIMHKAGVKEFGKEESSPVAE